MVLAAAAAHCVLVCLSAEWQATGGSTTLSSGLNAHVLPLD